MPTNVDNWLTRRGAGALFNLQRTPYVVGTDAITANPKKTQANQVHDHTRQYLTNWPASSVVKISGTGLKVNVLELETRYTYKIGRAFAQHHENTDQLALDIGTAVSNGVTQFTAGAPVIWPTYFGGSDYSLYDYAEWIMNDHYQLDKDGDGVAEDYYDVYQVNVTPTSVNGAGIGEMTYYCSTSKLIEQTSETTGAYTATPPPGFSSLTIYANFGTTKLYASDCLSAAPAQGPYTAASFCARHTDDSAHGLAAYVTKFNNVPYLDAGSTNVGYIGSYRHTSTDSPSDICLQADCECKFFYTPDACDDCWYAGKTVTIDITYKQIQFTDNGPTEDGDGRLDKSVTKGSATTHSTVTKTLTLPTGLTRQQVGSTFTVPTLAGYAVVIDDIKLVSVS